MTTTMAFMLRGNQFEKPLNPVLGETYQARGADGAQIYAEQTAHHPPITHILIDGPDNRYTFTSWTGVKVKFSMTSITVSK